MQASAPGAVRRAATAGTAGPPVYAPASRIRDQPSPIGPRARHQHLRLPAPDGRHHARGCLATHAGRRGNPSGRPRKGRDAAGRCASGYEPSAMLLRAWMGAESAAPCAAAFARRAMHRGFTGEEVGGSTRPGETTKLQRRGPVVNRDNRPPEPQGDQSSANPPLVSGLTPGCAGPCGWGLPLRPDAGHRARRPVGPRLGGASGAVRRLLSGGRRRGSGQRRRACGDRVRCGPGGLPLRGAQRRPVADEPEVAGGVEDAALAGGPSRRQVVAHRIETAGRAAHRRPSLPPPPPGPPLAAGGPRPLVRRHRPSPRLLAPA